MFHIRKLAEAPQWVQVTADRKVYKPDGKEWYPVMACRVRSSTNTVEVEIDGHTGFPRLLFKDTFGVKLESRSLFTGYWVVGSDAAGTRSCLTAPGRSAASTRNRAPKPAPPPVDPKVRWAKRGWRHKGPGIPAVGRTFRVPRSDAS